MAMTPKEHIDYIRKNKFSIGGEPNPLMEDLHQAVKNLSAELYAKDAHFLMEIIQNAEDNVYEEGVKPSLEFIVTSRDITGTGAPSTLLVFNNEKGFSAKNIESISSVGRSTKKGQRQQGYIGEKGIGFKSVFLITAQPYIFSNGYQIRFTEEPDPLCHLGYIVPEWVEEKPTLGDIQSIYGINESLPATTIVLPLKPDKEQGVKQQLSGIHPEALLFLSKIRRLSVRKDNKDSSLNTVSAVSISSETDFVTRKNVSAESYTLHLSAEEDCDDSERECSYYMWKQKFPVKQENRVERRMEVDDLVITLAFPIGERLNRGRLLPGIYAFLPTEMVTNFPFIIQADFLLASSREKILYDNKWNIGILDCVPSAFVNAFISLLKTSGAAPTSSLASMFKFLPVESSSDLKLNIVRDSIKDILVKENIVPSESCTEQKLFHKPSEVGRILPAFWTILIKAREEGVSLHNLSSHGTYALNSAFDTEDYNDILNFLEVRSMDNEWYSKCIQSSNLVLGLSEDIYMELLFFVADKWNPIFHYTNMKAIPLLKYVRQDGHISTVSVNEVKHWVGKKLSLSYDACHICWLIDWNKEFRCAACFFMPKRTQEAVLSFRRTETLKKWLSEHVGVSVVTVNDYAGLLLNSLSNDRRLVVALAHFLCQSLLRRYILQHQVENLCKKMPLLDYYACVTTQRNGVLIPANGSKWMRLIGSNLWRTKNYVQLGDDYLHAGNYAGVHTSEKEILMFLKTHVRASDIPDLCPPDDAFPAASSPLTKENTFFLLEWIRNLKRKGMPLNGKFLGCIKQGSWLRTYVGNSVGYRPPSQSFLLTPSWGNLLKDGSEMVDIPLIDQQYYDNRILDYKDELITIGVMTEFGEACKFIGNNLMFVASNHNLTRENVFSILNFIKLLREKCLPADDYVKSIKDGQWLRTSHGERSPVGSILFDSSWEAASKICNLPFIDLEYYGARILSFRTELQLLGVVVGFDKNYQRLADCFIMPAPFTSMRWGDISLILECVRHSPSPDQLVSILKSKQWLKTTEGFKSPSECFLFDSDWGCLLQIFPGFPVISEKSYGDQVFSYKNELRKLGVVVDFEKAAKVFSRRFKEYASLSSITKDNVLLFLKCYRALKKTLHRLELYKSICDEKWLRTRLGQRPPKESILFSSDWQYLAPIALLPFIDDSELSYGTAIHEYKEELKAIGVVVEFNTGLKFVAAGLRFPENPTDIAPSSVRSLLECVRNMINDNGDFLPKEFLARTSKRWLKTSMGYRQPNECLLFGSEWKSLLQCEDAPFIDDKFYGFDLVSYQKELHAIGVVVDIGNGCQLVAEQLQSHSVYDVIARIYLYLKKYDWKPENKAFNCIWIPNGSDKGQWVRPEDCVLYDKDALFGLQLKVLDKHYEMKLLTFFSMALEVRRNPSVDDYCSLWRTWENSEYQLTPAECCAFWICIFKHWNPKTKGSLAGMGKLPVTRDADVILLVNKQDVFIPDDLLLVDLFEKSSPDPIFIWYPQPSSPSLPRMKLHEIYGSIGVQLISKSVQRTELSTLDVEVKEVTPREVLVKRGLIRLVLGFLSDPSIDMDANKRQSSVKALLDVNVLKTEGLISVSYTLSLPSGKSINVKACEMIRWERESSKIFIQNISNLSEQKDRIQFATYFSKVIADGLLWEKEDRIAELSELIKLGWLLDFDEEAITFLLKTKNLHIFMEDEEFLASAFSESFPGLIRCCAKSLNLVFLSPLPARTSIPEGSFDIFLPLGDFNSLKDLVVSCLPQHPQSCIRNILPDFL
ncbi:ATP/DNA binding protein [Thalictrum thalictroides]|uniref:ATP/DNA binding protein n=1 Tax=Thalictrum thalictroides TaxID=46969 RepID=A0A7J6W7C5_THATH|nr:ATP/DNA binding protein [Thalictrum thalictroides]